MIEYENYFNSELIRLYKTNQMIKGLGMTYEILDVGMISAAFNFIAFKQICKNQANIAKAIAYAKEQYQDRLIDF